MDTITLTEAQVQKAQGKLNGLIKAARKAFLAANPSYADIAVDADDAKISGVLAGDEVALAELRINYVLKGRSTATLDLLGVKTEAGVDEAKKYTMIPYVAAKRYRFDGSTWKAGYQSPDDSTPLNTFLDGSGKSFQVLRSAGLFQLMSEAEIDDFTGKLPVDFNLYFNLFM
jgi:hypothetical protein